MVAWPGALYIAQTRVRIGMVTLSKDEGLPHAGGSVMLADESTGPGEDLQMSFTTTIASWVDENHTEKG